MCREYTTIFITGFVVLVIELLGGRIMAPFYGNSIYVWAAMIGITIASLAIGYYIGGRFAKRVPVSLICLGIIISVIPMILNHGILEFTSDFGVAGGSLFAATLLFAPALILFGMFSPMMIHRLSQRDKDAGNVSGKVFAIGTAGSFFGAILTGFVLIPSLEINLILFLCLVLMTIVNVIWSGEQNKKSLLFNILGGVITVTTIVLTFMFIMSATDDSVVFDETSMYGNVKVIDIRGDFYAVLIDGSLQSFVEQGDEFDSSVPFESYSQIVIAMKPDMENLLVLGLGSGAVSHEFEQKGLDVTTIEIDPNIVKMSSEIFNYNGNVVIDDARHFIQTSGITYDSIVYDIAVGDSFPPHLYSQEAFQSMENNMSDDGVLAIHFDGELDGMKIKSLYKTLDSVFRQVFIISLGEGMLDAKMFYATNGSIDKGMINDNMIYAFTYQGERDTYSGQINKRIDSLEGGIILTDSYNPIDIWQAESSQAWREYAWENFGDYL